MLRFTASGANPRYKKGLFIALIVFGLGGLLYSWGSIDSSLATYGGVKLPDVPGWLGNASPWSKGEPALPDSMNGRQRLGNEIHGLFTEYPPSIAGISKSFIVKWPTMKAFELGKKYDYNEVAAASQDFFVDEAAYDEFKAQQQVLMEAIPKWDAVSAAYSGRGIVICAGSQSLARVWPNAVLMLRSLNCTLPIEVWTKDQEEYQRTLPVVEQMRTELQMEISAHSLSDYIHIVWKPFPLSEIFKVKALALLFSSFEEVVLFDSDSIPVMDPAILFDSEEAESGLIQWPDFWTNSVSTVLHDAYDIDYTMTRTCESGQVYLNKQKQFEPLVMATYFNWYGPDFFYKPMYLDSMGAGDKDTFWMGSAVYHRGYHVVKRDLELIPAKKTDGKPWKDQANIFNGAMGQFNPGNISEIFSMHMHAPKINLYGEELRGQFDIQFFQPEEKQNAAYAMGAVWLETRLWENLQWIECESIMRDLGATACEGITRRVLSLREKHD